MTSVQIRPEVAVCLLLGLPLLLAAAPPVGAACGSVLIYYGNGGVYPNYFNDPRAQPDQSNYYQLESLYRGWGLQVDYTDAWPADVPSRTLVILVGPGAQDDTGTYDFTPDQVTELLELLQNGGRILLLGEHHGFGWGTQNRLLEDLQVGIRLSLWETGHSIFRDLVPDQITDGLPYLDGCAMQRVEVNGTAISLANAWDSPWAVDRSALTTCERPGCDVVVLGDFNVIDDFQYYNWDILEDWPDTLNEHWLPLARNLVDYAGALTDPSAALRHRCEARARNHGEYVSCVARGLKELARRGCINMNRRGEIVREAAHEDIGFRH